jgi:queuine tRNA-ribosyltransferase
LAKIDENGVAFTSVLDGSSHYLTPEKSIQIQHDLGADIIVAFDECTAPDEPYEYQREAMDRTHRWAARSLAEHKKLSAGVGKVNQTNGKKNTKKYQALFGVVQGGRYEDLRRESARTIGAMDFDGYCIGGSFDKDDIYQAVEWVTDLLDEKKPRHLLGMGEIVDLFEGVERGIDTFDCVSPTRLARNGSLYTRTGRINIMNAEYMKDFSPIDAECGCPVCKNYSRAYLAHLFRAKEMLASTLASQHNIYFLTNLVAQMREKIIDGTFAEFKKSFKV